MKRLACLALVFVVLLLTPNGYAVEPNRNDFLGMGIGTLQGGLLLSHKYDRYFADWFSLGLQTGVAIGVDTSYDTKDGAGNKYPTNEKTDWAPHIGLMAYLQRFKIWRMGFGVEGYYRKTNIELTDGALKYVGSDEKAGYNFNFMILGLRFSPLKDQDARKRLTLDINAGIRFLGTKQTTDLRAANGWTTTISHYDNNGLYAELVAGYRF